MILTSFAFFVVDAVVLAATRSSAAATATLRHSIFLLSLPNRSTPDHVYSNRNLFVCIDCKRVSRNIIRFKDHDFMDAINLRH